MGTGSVWRSGFMRSRAFWIAVALLVGVLMPRLLALGYFPEMDEGHYAMIAQYIHDSLAAGLGFPADVGGLQLFPAMLSWLEALPGNHMLWLRLADLLMAIICGLLLCLVLMREARSVQAGAILAMLCLLGMHHPVAIDNGLKNSFMPAFACLFAALLAADGARGQSVRWFLAGALAAFGVLFRETFAPFALLGAASLLVARNFGACWRFIAGGLLAAAAVLGISALVRGGLWPIVSMYIEATGVYEAEQARVWPLFREYGALALLSWWPLLLLAVCGLAAMLRERRGRIGGRACFWLAAGILPILEPLAKIGFLYHFSVCLPGFAGFCACCFSRVPLGENAKKTALAMGAIGVLCMLPAQVRHMRKLPVTLEVATAWNKPCWPEHFAEQSSTVDLAKRINVLAAPGAPIASSAFTFFIYPASGHPPASMNLADLSRAWLRAGKNGDRFLEALEAGKPELVILADAEGHSASFCGDIEKAIRDSGKYELADSIPSGTHANYGWLSYRIYKRI